jgi:hypothetical protein
MPALHNYRLFISHAWDYTERYNRAVKFLNDANNFRSAEEGAEGVAGV